MLVHAFSIMIDPVNEMYRVGFRRRKKVCSLNDFFQEIPLFTGQNLAMGYDNWTQALEGWIEEKEHYFYGYPATGIVSHYTQVHIHV